MMDDQTTPMGGDDSQMPAAGEDMGGSAAPAGDDSMGGSAAPAGGESTGGDMGTDAPAAM